jgi:uncharacterized protein YdcH (DUF465 family)
MEKHDLHNEFPQYEQKIHDLKTSNNHFKKLFDEYHHIDKQIHSVEASSVFTDDELTEMRKKRLLLKDQLLHIIEDRPIHS